MGKKRKNGKKFEVPLEAKEKAECIMAMQMFQHCSEQEIYQALVECEMDFDGAVRRLSNRERKRYGEEKEKEERDGRGANGANGESRAIPDCPKQLTKHSRNVKWIPSTSFINLLEKGNAKTRAGVPAEWKEQVERIKEIVKEMEPKFTEEEIYKRLEQCNMDRDLATQILLANSLEELEEAKSERKKKKVNAPSFTPSASILQSPQTLLQGTNLSAGHGFTHPYIEPSYHQPQLPLQHGYMNGDGCAHQNFGYDMTSPQQEVYQGGSLSWANVDPSSWGSFPDRGNTPHQFLPNSFAPSDSSGTQLNSALHVQAQRQHRNDYWPNRMKYNFAALNSQPNPGAMSAHPEQQQSGLPEWVPLPSDGNNQHHDMSSAQQEVYQGGCSSWANGNASDWGSIQGTGNTSYQSPPIPPHSPSPFNISSTSDDPTLQAQDQNRNDHHFLIFPGLAPTPGGSFFPGRVPLPANARNQHAGEGSSPQYVHQGYLSWHHPGMTVCPNHLQQSPYNTGTGNSQDLSTMQPSSDLGP